MDLFHELADPWTTIVSGVVLVAAVVYAWKNALSPLWGFLRGRVHKQDESEILSEFVEHIVASGGVEANQEMWVVLKKFAAQMPPNGGPTIWESLEAHAKALEAIENKLDTFILQRRPNGRRSYDPHTPEAQ